MQNTNSVVVFLVYFFGVLAHEASHFIVSLLTLGKPIGFTIIPVKKELIVEEKKYVYWEFGHVVARNTTFLNSFYIGLAPLLLMPLAYLVYVNFFNFVPFNGLNIVFLHAIVFVLLFNSFPSEADIKVAFSSAIGVVVNVVMLTTIYLKFNYIQGVSYEVFKAVSSYIHF
ncbi:MAG: hypothetical protein AB7D43_10640 [Sulfurimonadaceae bacterium]